MKIGAVCPTCDTRVSRYRSVESKSIRCARCGVMIKSTGVWWSNLLAGVLFAAFLVTWIGYRFLKAIDFPLFLAIGIGYLVVFWIAGPYVIRFKQVSHGPVCAKCGYELRGCRGGDCPECGAPIDVPIPRGDDQAP